MPRTEIFLQSDTIRRKLQSLQVLLDSALRHSAVIKIHAPNGLVASINKVINIILSVNIPKAIVQSAKSVITVSINGHCVI